MYQVQFGALNSIISSLTAARCMCRWSVGVIKASCHPAILLSEKVGDEKGRLVYDWGLSPEQTCSLVTERSSVDG